MATVTFTSSVTGTRIEDNRREFAFGAPNQFPAAWQEGPAARYLIQIGLSVRSGGTGPFAWVVIGKRTGAAGGFGHELHRAVAAGVRLTLESGGESVSLEGFGGDETEPYTWFPAEGAALGAWAATLTARSAVTAIFEYPPPRRSRRIPPWGR